MIEIKEGKITGILSQKEGITVVDIEINGIEHKGINYKSLTGEVEIGDRVIVNTSATSLSLGTGGYDFIIYILGKQRDLKDKGHIMKLRYTPYQLQTCSLAEEDSGYQEIIKSFISLEGLPVIVGTLHSMLVPIALMIKEKNPEAKISYIMTDGAALPISFSKTVHYLKKEGLIDNTITIGHSFGGDLESVNIYSALIGAKEINKSDAIIVTMGPGIVGTGTKYGFSGTEQVDVLHAVNVLGGDPIGVPRISFADKRKRHYGISHHSRTNFGELALIRSSIAIPNFEGEKSKIIQEQLRRSGIIEKHNLTFIDGEEIIESLDNLSFKVKTMGRSHQEDKEYFMTAGVAGLIVDQKFMG
ncbi:DUF3866 family protein [Halonatronum saccharophilum]|uniref:DUF3866 family protein n=1 Tax=Halonatronum saccharophilum TaxID=150060 RepID=UPI00048791CA|nr:DUF3866 family protein [Halonatronum saccharophilum]